MMTIPAQTYTINTAATTQTIKIDWSSVNAGYIYVPYMPLHQFDINDVVDHTPRRGVMTRFGKKLVKNQRNRKMLRWMRKRRIRMNIK